MNTESALINANHALCSWKWGEKVMFKLVGYIISSIILTIHDLYIHIIVVHFHNAFVH